ncbi:MAG: KH domain-containing protein [Patescibacteria group bacterium]
MSEIDQQFIEYVVKSLVGNPDAVTIERRIDEKGVLLELTVDPEDLGRVIGKRGATAQSLRTLLRALGTKNDARYNLKIIDNGPLDHERPERPERPARDDKPAPAKSSDDAPADDVANDSSKTNDDTPAPVEEVAEAPAPEPEAPSEEDQTSDRLRQTRAELADLDDLDV